MAFGSLKLKLRPLRLAFLVRPSDQVAIATAVETASFLWGGAFNPIIPVYRKLPKFWERDSKLGLTARSVLEGYLDAFDPDFVVKVGSLESEELKFGHREVIKCSEILATVEKDGSPKFGIGMLELLQHFADKELKFVRHEPLPICLPKLGSRHRLFLASVFGVFPAKLEKASPDWWKDLAGAECKKCTLDNYSDFLVPGNLFLRRLGTLNIRPVRTRSFRRQDCIFLMNADQPLDIIDYWNLRALGWNVIPACQQAVSNPGLQKLASEFVEENSFAFRGNPDFFNDTIILRSRTVSPFDVEKFGRSLKLSQSKHPHENKIVYHFSYPRIWDEWAREKDAADPCELEVSEDEHEIGAQEKSITFRSLMPDFASRFGGDHKPRCANEIELRIWSDESLPAEVVPEGDWQLARAAGALDFDGWRCGKSGLVHLPRHKNWRERLNLTSAESVFSAWLKAKGWETEFSNSGHIARQMLKHLHGVFGVGLLAKRSVIELFEKLAVGQPSREEDDETSDENQNDLAQQDSGRTLPAEKFRGALAKIANEDKYQRLDADRLAERFVENRMVQLGLKLQCPGCRQRSWFSVKEADYELRCPQCLDQFRFPEHRPKEIDWAYRAIGPFSLPQRAYGVYSVLLTLRFFARLLDGATTPMLSFNAKKGSASIEADLGIFFQRTKFAPSRTEVVFAECKTFKRFKQKDALRMLTLAKEFPGAVLVFATLNNSLTNAEKRLLRPVVNRGRKYWKSERPYNPVLILTGNELFAENDPRQVWKELGDTHAAHTHSWGDERDLVSLADDTQQIYLGMKPWRESVRARQKASRRKMSPAPGTSSQTQGLPANEDVQSDATMTASFSVAMRQVPWR